MFPSLSPSFTDVANLSQVIFNKRRFSIEFNKKLSVQHPGKLRHELKVQDIQDISLEHLKSLALRTC